MIKIQVKEGMFMNGIVADLVNICQNPAVRSSMTFAKAITSFLQENSVAAAMKEAGGCHMKAVEDIAAALSMEQEKNPEGALQRMLMHLEAAYHFYLDYYKKLPKRWRTDIHIPYLWIFNEAHVALRKTDSIEALICRICFLMAVCHKALGNSGEIIQKWLCDTPFPCNDYEILKGLLGEEEAVAYLAEHPVRGDLVADSYLSEKGICLEDYYVQKGYGGAGISFGEEDPIIYLD